MRLYRHCCSILLSAALSCCLFAPQAWSEPATSCASSLAIDAVEEDSIQLRQAFVNGLLNEIPASSCDGVSLRLERDGEVLRVFVDQEGQIISREVTSVETAAMWVEAWLAPPTTVSIESPSPESGGALERTTSSQDLIPNEADPERHHIETRLQVVVAPSFDGDGSIWLGPEVSVAVLLRRALWLGGGLGPVFWIWPNPGGERFPADIPLVRFALRLGGRLFLNDRLNLDLGAGVGLTVEPHSQMEEKLIPFGEVMGELEVIVWRSISFHVGLLARINMRYLHTRDAVNTAAYTEHPEEVITPPVASIFAGELRVGFSYTFGRRQ